MKVQTYCKLGIATLLAAMLSSCQEVVSGLDADEPMTLTEDLLLNEYYALLDVAENPQLSQDEAIGIANDLINGPTEVRGGGKKRVASVDVMLSTPSVRSASYAGVDTAMFIVNYADNEGFVLVSGDRRTSPILGLSDKGNFKWVEGEEVSEFLKYSIPLHMEKEVKLFEEQVRALEDSCQARLAVATRTSGSLSNVVASSPPHKPRYFQIPEKPRRIVNIIMDTVGTCVNVRWHQYHPFNSQSALLTNSSGQEVRALAGCVSVAIAQLMAYHRYPSSLQGFHYDWGLLTKYPVARSYHGEENVQFTNQVGRLLRQIADSSSVKWGINGTTVGEKGMDGIRQALVSFGYESGPCDWYNLDKIAAEIEAGRPVLIGGAARLSTQGETPQYTGHIWLTDSYITVLTKDIRNKMLFLEFTRKLLHCNWGSAGEFTGYYHSGVFDVFNPMYNGLGTVGTPLEHRRYNEYLYCYKGIRPAKF